MFKDGAPPQPWDEVKNEVNLQEIQAAKARLDPYIPPTPISKSLFNSDRFGFDVYLKLENFNISGSFKIRGAGNSLLANRESDQNLEVVAASAGNHAQGVAYMSRILGRRAKIFMPERTPIVKVAATKSHGAEVILTGAIYDDAYQAAIDYSSKHPSTLIHAFSDAQVINGQGTCGLEILSQLDSIGAVVVAVGGGGFIGGVGCAIKNLRPDIKIVGVQTTAFPSMKDSLIAGKIVGMPSNMTIADGIAVKRPSTRTLALAQRYVDEMLVVSDDDIAASIMNLMEKDHILAEGAGAASVAALQVFPENLRKLANGKSVCCIISGGNIDMTLLGRISGRGLVATGRMMRLKIRMVDKPGQLAELLQAISKTGANLIDVRHNRLFGALYYSDVDVEIDLETTDFNHQKAIKEKLNSLNFNYSTV